MTEIDWQSIKCQINLDSTNVGWFTLKLGLILNFSYQEIVLKGNTSEKSGECK